MHRQLPALWLLAGCPWVSPAEHERNQRDLGEADADTDTDADSDTDTDTDADTDTWVCPEDLYEPNSDPINATRVTPPFSGDFALCPTDVSATLGVVADLFEVDVGADQVLHAEIRNGPSTDCADQALLVTLADPSGVVRDAFSSGPVCGEVVAGFGPGDYLVSVTADPAHPGQTYGIELWTETCSDNDGDGFLSNACNGPDCNDGLDVAFPGANEIRGDGVDQDCDGGDDLVPDVCTPATTATVSGSGTLPCGDLVADAVWDRWIVSIPNAGDELSVVVQNGSGNADPVALVIDPNGDSHYGLAPDRSELDDEATCDELTWSGGLVACPGECLAMVSTGDATLWVAQHPGTGCVDGASYELLVTVNGEDVSATLFADDVALGWP